MQGSQQPQQGQAPRGGAGIQQGQPAPPSQPKPERDPGSETVFRTSNFFVHIVTPLMRTGALRTGALRRAGGGGETIVERIRWTSVEKQRLMAAQTRLLPQADAIDAAQWRRISIPSWLEMLVVALLLAIPVTIQAFNMFNYPAYTVDEGNFMANAWAVLHGRIELYTYAYDHPPIGWLQLAAWLQLTGGVASFGNAINSGRFLMLLLGTGCSLFLYLITSRMSGSRSAALLAALIYSLSPLSLLYRNEILIDNIAMFWLLLSLCLITTGKSRLLTFVLAAGALGVAILTQETFILFLPAVLYAVWLYATEFQRKFSLLTFLYITLAIASIYVLIALLQGQLLPTGVFPGDTKPHPSLIAAFILKWQAVPANGKFSDSWDIWTQADWLLLAAGIIAMFLNVLGGTVNRFQLLTAGLAATFCIFLLVSNVVYPFSIVALLPFLALNIAIAFNTPLRWLTGKIGFDLVRALLCFILIGVVISANAHWPSPRLAKSSAEPQRQAMLWARSNMPHNSVVIANSYMFTDLHEPGGMAVGTGKPFDQAYTFSSDALASKEFNDRVKGDWQKIDFLIVDASMLTTIRTDTRFALLNQALHHSNLRVQFGAKSDGTLIQIYQVTR